MPKTVGIQTSDDYESRFSWQFFKTLHATPSRLELYGTISQRRPSTDISMITDFSRPIENPVFAQRASWTTPAVEETVSSWGKFCDDSTTHGLRFCCGTTPRTIVTRFCWALGVLAGVALTLYFCLDSILSYVEYEVGTWTSLKSEDEIMFPAITFCNEMTFRRSVVLYDTAILQEMAAFSASSKEEFAEIASMLAQNKPPSSGIDHLLGINDSSNQFWQTRGMGELFQKSSLDSKYSVKKCWWQEEEVDCSTLFLNRATDFGWCFTFNPGPDIIARYNLYDGSNNSTGMTFHYDAYGLSTNRDHTTKTLTTGGWRNGIRLVLKVGQNDYLDHDIDSAGFQFIVHHPHADPLLSLEEPIALAAGSDVSAAIALTKVQRRTKNLDSGKSCTDSESATDGPKSFSYFKQECHRACFSDYVKGKCGCIPFYIVSKSPSEACWSRESLQCSNAAMETFSDSSLDVMCSKCLQACEELQYGVKLSYKQFPIDNFQMQVADELNVTNLHKSANEALLAKDYLTVNFYIESMRINFIIETTVFTQFDLYANVGGLVGLFMGMSLISIVEFLHQTVYWSAGRTRVVA